MKFKVRDEDGNNYTIEEMIESTASEPETLEKNVEDEDATTFTADEITALKSLASVADKLVALIDSAVQDSDDEDDDATEVNINVDNDENDDASVDVNGEEIVETSEDNPLKKDSKKSFGAIESKKDFTDSIDDDSISLAWSKRYNGGRA